jgi:predicted alpha/beta-hydrolase family hydrolase
MPDAEAVTITLDSGDRVSGLWLVPPSARACLVLAHGAGAGMAHKSMATLASGLAARDVATLRYQFLYMERGSKRPDAPPLAHKVVRAAVAEAARRAGKLPLFAGGRSFGGRMTSQAQAIEPLPRVRGLVFFAFPLHPAGKPSDERAAHLKEIDIPMLFLSGSNDALASLDRLRPVVADLAEHATLKVIDGADHSFHVPAKSGRKDADVLAEILDSAADWMTRFAFAPVIPGRGPDSKPPRRE